MTSPEATAVLVRTIPGRWPRRIGAAACWTIVSFLACAGPASEALPPATLEVSVSPTPATVGPATVLVEVVDSAGRPLESARVSLVGRVSGGGAVVRDTAEGGRRGRYAFMGLPFPVPGEWELRIRADLSDGVTVETTEEIRVLRDRKPEA